MNIKNKKWLITGATGSFGTAFIKRLLSVYEPAQVRAFSRDELKQSQLKTDLDVDWLLGDVRDVERVTMAARGVDVIVHAAALKRIEKGERDPYEFVKTNVLGTINVASAAIGCEVEMACFISTDKAVEPVNLYGATKMVAEKAWIASNSYAGDKRTSLVAVRYGNVIGSRGSVLDVWKSQIERGDPITITEIDATRFFLPMHKAIDLVLTAVADGQRGETFIPVCKSVEVGILARVYAKDWQQQYIGIQPGEKFHESLMSAHEVARARVVEGYPHVIIPPASPSWHYEPRGEEWVLFGWDGAYTSDVADMLQRDEIERELSCIEPIS